MLFDFPKIELPRKSTAVFSAILVLLFLGVYLVPLFQWSQACSLVKGYGWSSREVCYKLDRPEYVDCRENINTCTSGFLNFLLLSVIPVLVFGLSHLRIGVTKKIELDIRNLLTSRIFITLWLTFILLTTIPFIYVAFFQYEVENFFSASPTLIYSLITKLSEVIETIEKLLERLNLVPFALLIFWFLSPTLLYFFFKTRKEHPNRTLAAILTIFALTISFYAFYLAPKLTFIDL